MNSPIRFIHTDDEVKITASSGENITVLFFPIFPIVDESFQVYFQIDEWIS